MRRNECEEAVIRELRRADLIVVLLLADRAAFV